MSFVIGTEFLEYDSQKFRGIDNAIMAVDNFSRRGNKNSVWQRTRPGGIENLYQGIGIGAREEIVVGFPSFSLH